MDFVARLKETLTAHSLTHYGWAPLERPRSIDFYKNWLRQGHHASMDYLVRHLEAKENPQSLVPWARAAIVVAKDYFPHPYADPSLQPVRLRTALYAQGRDYHLAFKAELESLAESLRRQFPKQEFLCFTDSSPVLERELAYRAGIGWIGKNTCTIDSKRGSLFFIGEIFTTLPLGEDFAPHPDMCGTCNRCIEACPTGAIESAKVLNAGKCISFWTIEAKEAAPPELRAKFGDWFFGCDICQTVCPWNEKVFGRETMRDKSPAQLDSTDLAEDLRWILRSSNSVLNKRFGDLPYSRARPAGLKRNALYIIGNLRLHELKPDVLVLAEDEKFRDLANWTLNLLS